MATQKPHTEFPLSLSSLVADKKCPIESPPPPPSPVTVRERLCRRGPIQKPKFEALRSRSLSRPAVLLPDGGTFV